MPVILPGSAVTFKASGGTVTHTLTSLASGAGRLSARNDQGATASQRRYLVECVTKMVAASTPTIGERISVYAIRSDGTNADGALGTSDAALTEAQIAALQGAALFLGDIIVTSDDPTTVLTLRTVVEIPSRYFSIVWINRTSLALSATAGDHITTISPLDDSITSTVLAADAIGASEIADDAIDAAAIAADAITNAKIADNAFASEQFALSAGEKTTDGVVVTRATAALPQTAAAAIFTVTGLVLVKRIVGYVTTVIGAVANATKLKANSTGAGATTDLCGTLDINAHAVDSRYEITGTFANAMVRTLDVPLALVQAANIVIPPGTIDLDCAGSDGGTGRVRWSITYVPLESGAQIVAA